MLPPDLPSHDVALTRSDYVRLARGLEQAMPDARKVAVLASFTADFIKPYLLVEAARRQFPVQAWLAPYGQIEQQAVDPGSALYQYQPDVVVILPRMEDLAPELVHRFLVHDEASLKQAGKALLARFEQVLHNIRSHTPARVLLGNMTPPAWCAAGLADVSLEMSQHAFVQWFNGEVAKLCRSFADVLPLDVCRVASEVGLERWRDERLEFLARAPWSADGLTALAKHLARRLRSWHVPAAKCLVLDMDHTLWGGVLGEVGLHGIGLGLDHPGNVFVDFQRRLLALRDSGILLAAASKNNAADAEEVLASHPACLLKREHFSAFEVHWEDKATSLRRIAATLNIGLDALVFFDDNPTERAWVRSQLPEVTVLEVPENPLGYARVLAECGCFDQPALTREDRGRAELYVQDSKRQALKKQAGSLGEFLQGLDMTLTLGVVDEDTLPRFVQLLGKTNQFNLTTRRHSEADVRAMMERGGLALWAKLKDRFGDNGLIAAAIAVPESAATWRLDTFLMSCRVIGRGVETMLLAALERLAGTAGAATLQAEFIPTSKNQPAAAFLPSHGFVKDAADASYWQRTLSEQRPLPACFRLEGISIPS